MGSTQDDFSSAGELSGNTLSVNETITSDAGVYAGEGSQTSDVTDYSWFTVPGDGVNPPRVNRFETYDFGTGAWRGIYLHNGTFYAI